MTQRTIVILSFALFVCALLWGGFSLIVYLGIPIHQLVYSTPQDIQMWDLACGTGQTNGVYLCRGAAVIFPFLGAVFNMASPFFFYIILSFLAFAGVIIYAGFQTGRFMKTYKTNALVVGLFSIAAVWLLGTTFSLGTTYNLNTPNEAMITDINGQRVLPSFRRFFEPTEQVYGGAGSQALAELRANYELLLSRGCLKDTGVQTQNGAKLYDLRFWCMQLSFFDRAGTQVVMVLLLLFNLLILGRLLITKVIGYKTENTLLLACFSIGVGALAWVAILWSIGVLALLNTTFIRLLFFGMPILLFPQSRWWAFKMLEKKIDVTFSFKSWHLFLAWLVISYVALNFFNVVRPFPIGWDDLGSYLNRPRLLASYGYFIPSMSQFQWEYLTSLGFLLFGYDSWIGSTFAMEVNWAAGMISVLVVYAFGRRMFGRGRGLIAAIMYYFLPMTGHFSFADMKIDNASFFTTALGVMAVFAFLFPAKDMDESAEPRDPRLLIIAGLMLGFSFAIKPTAILGVVMALSVLIGGIAGPLGLFGAIVAGFGLLQKFGAINVTEVFKRALIPSSVPSTMLAFVVLGIGLAIIGFVVYKNRQIAKPLLVSVGCMALGMAIAVAPWMLNNMAIVLGYNITGYIIAEDKAAYSAAAKDSVNGNLNVGTLLTANDTIGPQIFYVQKEDIATMGLPSTVPVRYLPPELKVDPNNAACKSSARQEELDRYWGFGNGLNHYLGLAWRQVMNADSFGYYVTLVPALLLFPLLLLLPFFWSKEGRWLRLLMVTTFVFFIQWSLAANGVPWYGIGMFLGFAMVMEAFIAHAPDKPNRSIFGFLIAMSIIICLANRLWQFDTQKNLFEYPLGKISASALREVTIPNYDDIRESVVSRHEATPETPYTYRIGTFISYFIPRNREIFPLADHQMNFFNCINQERNHVLTLRRLRALGFNSIIFDTNTQTIEKDPNGPLHQKVAKFLDFANDPAVQLQIVVNDPNNGIAYILLPEASGSVLAVPKP